MGFFDQLKDTGNLLKNTFVVIKKNPAILRPTITETIWGAIFSVFMILGILFIFLGKHGALYVIGILLLVLSIIVLAFVFPFIKIYYRAAQTWIVYKTFSGQPATYQDGLNVAKNNKGDIFVLGLADIIMSFVSNQLKSGTGRGGFGFALINILMWVLGKVVEEVWDLIGHFLLPACIINEGKTVKDVLPELKNIKNNIPGALMGVFGFDFAGDIVKKVITKTMMFIAIVIGVLFLLLTHSWVLLAILVALVLIFNSLALIFIDMTKTIYFTLMYISVTMPSSIAKEYKTEVTNYLLKQQIQPSTTVVQQPAKKEETPAAPGTEEVPAGLEAAPTAKKKKVKKAKKVVKKKKR